MNVIVVGKPGCKTCDETKAWLEGRGIEHLFVDLNDPPDGWQELGISGALVVYAWKNESLPVVRWRGTWMTALEARRRIEHDQR